MIREIMTKNEVFELLDSLFGDAEISGIPDSGAIWFCDHNLGFNILHGDLGYFFGQFAKTSVRGNKWPQVVLKKEAILELLEKLLNREKSKAESTIRSGEKALNRVNPFLVKLKKACKEDNVIQRGKNDHKGSRKLV